MGMPSSASVLASALALGLISLAACSSTATGTSGGTSSGGGRGLLGGIGGGGGGSSGTTSGTTGGTSTSGGTTSSGSPANICAQATESCDVCGCQKCPSQVQGCFGTANSPCQLLLDCGSRCQQNDSACFQACLNNYSAGQAPFQNLYSCLQSNCATPCDLPPPTSSSGGTSGPTPPPGGGG